MTDGLKDRHRAAIIATIAANDRVERAVLFGSRATGTHSVSSDVDIALIGDRLTLTDQARLAAALDEIPMAQAVDLLLYDSIQDRTLRDQIRRQGIEWYTRPSSLNEPGSLYRPKLPAHWARKSLYSMAHWVNGLAFGKIEFCDTGMPVIKIAEIKSGISNQTKFTLQNFDESVRVRTGDLLFSWSGQPETSIDAFWWRGPEGWLNQHVFLVTPAAGIDTSFLYYLLRYMKPNFVAIARNKQTTGLGHVTKRDMERIQAAAPPSREQRTIACFLGTLDDKIELNRQVNATLEAMARALFKSWFVDFDPVRSKMEGCDCGLPRGISELFPDRLVESETGTRPQAWTNGSLRDVALLNPESWSTKQPPEEVCYIDLANTKWGHIESVETYLWDAAPSRARRVLRRGDTVMGTVRPGNGSFALIHEDGLTGSTGFAVLRPCCPVDRAVIWCAATSSANLDRLSLLADGGAYPAVRPEEIMSTPVALADYATREAFARFADPLLDRVAANRRESRHLSALRDELLRVLISGELQLGTDRLTGAGRSGVTGPR